MVKKQLRHAHKSKDDRKQTKTTGLISKDTEVKRWLCVCDIVNRVQLVSARTMGHGYFQSQTECEEVISAAALYLYLFKSIRKMSSLSKLCRLVLHITHTCSSHGIKDKT